MVQEPESCSVMEATSASGSRPRTGPTMRSRYASAAWSGSISSADNPGTSGTAVMMLPIVSPNTCPTLEAGSVLTNKTFLPWPARRIAVAHATEVLPTPPLPVKKRKRGGWSRKFITAISSSRSRRSSRPPTRLHR